MSDEEEDILYPAHLTEAAAPATDKPHLADALQEEEDDDGGGEGHETKRLKTLLELAQGPNKAAALNEMEDQMYTIATLLKVIALRLVNSSGGRSPHIFDASTQQYVERNPRLNVQTGEGKGPTFMPDRDGTLRDANNDMEV